VLNSKLAADEMANLGNTTTGLRNLNGGIIGSVTFPGPPLSEQRAIADYLDTETARLDALITRKRRMIELLERRYIQTVTELVFSHGQIDERPRKPTVTKPQKVLEHHLASADPSWEVVPLRRVARLSSAVNSDGEAPLLSLTIRGETVPRPPDRQPPGPEYLLRYNQVRPGQLVVNPMWLVGGSIGVASRSGAVSPDYRVYDLDSRLRPAFAHHLLRSEPYRDQYQLLMRADTTFDRRVTKDDFHEVLVPVPGLAEQDSICERLDRLAARLDPVREGLERQLDLLGERRQALITAAVTGELEVPGVAA
jgi:type I restriction enzyme S subunit